MQASAIPFPSKMEYNVFRRIVDALKTNGQSLNDAYHAAEAIHREFCGADRFDGGFESFKNMYYKERRREIVPTETIAC